jgi:hypothetical protein
MSKTIRTVSALTLVALLAPLAQAAQDAPPIPNINKRGEDEKAFVKKMAAAIVNNGRTSVKTIGDVEYKKKEPKAGRTEFVITAHFKYAFKFDATANITVVVDSENKEKWEVLRVDYKDNVRGLPFNRKNIDALPAKMNGKAG